MRAMRLEVVAIASVVAREGDEGQLDWLIFVAPAEPRASRAIPAQRPPADSPARPVEIGATMHPGRPRPGGRR